MALSIIITACTNGVGDWVGVSEALLVAVGPTIVRTGVVWVVGDSWVVEEDIGLGERMVVGEGGFVAVAAATGCEAGVVVNETIGDDGRVCNTVGAM
jgi:hypothetical protein